MARMLRILVPVTQVTARANREWVTRHTPVHKDRRSKGMRREYQMIGLSHTQSLVDFCRQRGTNYENLRKHLCRWPPGDYSEHFWAVLRSVDANAHPERHSPQDLRRIHRAARIVQARY